MGSNYTIYILLTHSGSMFSKAINIYTRDPYTHVSIALDRDLEELYSFGRLRPYNPLLAGFVREDIVNGTFKRFSNTRCVLYALKVNKEQYDRVKKELDKFKMEANRYGYNLIGIIGAMFNHPIQRKYNYFCSQFVSEVLNNSGINILDKDPGLTSPMDFARCRDLEIIYEGRLSKYGLSRGRRLVGSYQ
ncbi:MAG: hypothetical protein AB2375_00785 [Tissierellaceae bacterium]